MAEYVMEKEKVEKLARQIWESWHIKDLAWQEKNIIQPDRYRSFDDLRDYEKENLLATSQEILNTWGQN